jgi:hypothetical protein
MTWNKTCQLAVKKMSEPLPAGDFGLETTYGGALVYAEPGVMHKRRRSWTSKYSLN